MKWFESLDFSLLVFFLILKWYFQVRRIYKDLIVRENCHPFKTVILHLVQIPFWILLTLSLRRISIPKHGTNIYFIVFTI